MENKHKKIFIIAGAIFMTVIIFGSVVYWQLNIGQKSDLGIVPVVEKVDKKIFAQDAHGLALARAQEWSADARLARMLSISKQADEKGRADSWELIYVSPTKKGLAYRIVITGKSLLESGETPFIAAGDELPADLVSSEQAIEAVRQIKGYENEPIISMEMVYDAPAKIWFWGVNTGKGVVTIRATK